MPCMHTHPYAIYGLAHMHGVPGTEALLNFYGFRKEHEGQANLLLFFRTDFGIGDLYNKWYATLGYYSKLHSFYGQRYLNWKTTDTTKKNPH
ncbi:hypothetical protein MHYP_G00184560 [Metynnis hypsauchen]